MLLRPLSTRHAWRVVSLGLMVILAIIVGLWGTVGTAKAHGHTTVGDYELVIGFHNEPAYQGEPNGLDLFVTNSKTGEKINGLASTLSAEIIYGNSAKSLLMKAQWGRDGAYTAYVLPTAVGNYTWHIFGSIQGTPVDVKMTSSPDTFSAVQSKSSVSFPSADPTVSELQQQIASANRLAVGALIVGIAGLLVGVGGMFFGMRNRRRVGENTQQAGATIPTGV